MNIQTPKSIQKYIKDKPYTSDTTGMSDSQILIFSDMVLKIEKHGSQMDATVQMMEWLNGKLPVPRIICYETDEEHQYLLMDKLTGTMACDPYYLEHPDELLTILAEGLKLLWSVDISDCPRTRNLDTELAEAEYRVKHNLVDLEHAEPDTFGENGFQNPAMLLEWLKNHKPECSSVLSHGDLCLPNIFLKDGKVSGFIDLGDTGVADPWRDISLLYRSLKHNFSGNFGGKVYHNFNPNLLFEKLEVEPDLDKLRYYILLDELF